MSFLTKRSGRADEVLELFDIAGLKVKMNCKDGLLYERSRAYLSDGQDEKEDFSLELDDDRLTRLNDNVPSLTRDECYYVYMGEGFYRRLLDFDGLLLHSSCIEKDGEAYLFSARSGTGKSTHTHLWMQTFGDVRMINDDKPAVRKIGDRFYACGTPFSGKNDESSNVCVPIRAIVFLQRAKENRIERLDPAAAIPLFLSQTIRPSTEEYMTKALSLLDGILKSVPVFMLYCNISEQAVHTAYDGINKYLNEVKENEN